MQRVEWQLANAVRVDRKLAEKTLQCDRVLGLAVFVTTHRFHRGNADLYFVVYYYYFFKGGCYYYYYYFDRYGNIFILTYHIHSMIITLYHPTKAPISFSIDEVQTLNLLFNKKRLY